VYVGLWKYSRHPNHFGEQTWWIGLLLLGYVASEPRTMWPICFGVLFNHSLDILVTLPLIESRMLRNGKRAAAFQKYPLRGMFYTRIGFRGFERSTTDAVLVIPDQVPANDVTTRAPAALQ
jgi:steroid 5-alpha reductase family enzyme